MADRVLTPRQLNRATLARQMLLGRESCSIPEAIERLAGLQAQVASPPYVGLWTRLLDFRRASLTELLERRQVVRAPLMRSTLHLTTARDYLHMRPALQPALTRALRAFFGERVRGLDIERLVIAARAYTEEAPRTFAELRAQLREIEPDRDPAALAYAVRTYLPLVQTPTGGAWGFGGSPAYALAEPWLGGTLAEPRQSLRHLVRRYLAAFGPATVKDVQAWSGMIGLSDEIDVFKSELDSYQDERGNELLDLTGMPRPPEDIPAPPRFLPEYDNLMLAHADRRRVIADAHRPRVFLPAGRVRATFLIDGFVRGTWKIEKSRRMAALVIEPFEPLAESVREALVEEGSRLVRFSEDRAEVFDVRFATSD